MTYIAMWAYGLVMAIGFACALSIPDKRANKPSYAVIVVVGIVGLLGLAVGLWGVHIPAPLGISPDWRGSFIFAGLAMLCAACIGFARRDGLF